MKKKNGSEFCMKKSRLKRPNMRCARNSLEKAGKPSPEVSENASTVGGKLPKLEITKFQGTYLDWMRFWNQFETEIDKAKLTQVAKFSYLKELLVPSVRSSIVGLPFTTEGYELKEPKLY